MRRKSAYILLIVMISVAPLSGAAQTHKVIFDTDFVFPPQDDAMALIFALNCPELEIVGITTVAGNKNVERVTRQGTSQATR